MIHFAPLTRGYQSLCCVTVPGIEDEDLQQQQQHRFTSNDVDEAGRNFPLKTIHNPGTIHNFITAIPIYRLWNCKLLKKKNCQFFVKWQIVARSQGLTQFWVQFLPKTFCNVSKMKNSNQFHGDPPRSFTIKGPTKPGNGSSPGECHDDDDGGGGW